jgi:hypothetical protein
VKAQTARSVQAKIFFEGFSAEEILALPAGQIDALILNGEPHVLRIGSATVRGEFRRSSGRLVIELAQIEGGGEGILTALSALALRYAKQQKIEAVEWIVHAVHCAHPNLKLRRMLERRGFTIRSLPDTGEAYYLLQGIARDET